jgi:hypothetical protein
MSLLIFSLVNRPNTNIETNRGLAFLDFKICYRMFSPYLFKANNRFYIDSLGNKSFKT